MDTCHLFCTISQTQVFFAVLIGAFSLGQAVPYFQKLVTAAGASIPIYDIIDRVRGRQDKTVHSLLIDWYRSLYSKPTYSVYVYS